MGATRFDRPNVIREVGFTRNENGKFLLYSHIPVDEEGWADAKQFLPLRGDLVLLQMSDREINGWWAGEYWYGLRVKSTDRVKKWKCTENDYE